MASTVSIWDVYNQRQLDNEARRRMLEDELYENFPELKALDIEIKSLRFNRGHVLIARKAFDEVEYQNRLDELHAKRDAFLNEHSIKDGYMDSIYTCPKCKDTGRTPEGDLCECYQVIKSQLLIERSNLKGRLYKDTFASFNLDYYSDEYMPNIDSSPRQNAEIALANAKVFVENFPCGDNLLITGGPGLGKTFLTNCIAGELLNQAHTVCYFSSSKLFEIMGRNAFGAKSADDKEDLDNIYTSELLIIDDLGTELSSTLNESAIFAIINQRTMDGLSTVISTNLSLRQINDNYTERVASRIYESFNIIPLYGNNIRSIIGGK